MVESGHQAHATAMYNETYHLAWGDLDTTPAYPWPWTLGETPPSSTSIALEETVERLSGSTDPLFNSTVYEVLSIKNLAGTVEYEENTSWVLSGNSIDWSPGGAEPLLGVDYKVIYRYSETDITSLINEIGRRKASQVAYAVEDPNGDIQANGSRYSVVTDEQSEITDITCLSNISGKAAGTLDNRIFIVANAGYVGNITIVIEDDSTVTAGGETSSYNAITKTLTIGIEDGVSTEGQIALKLIGEALIDSASTATGLAWIIGAGTDTVTLVGGTGYSGSEYFTISSTTGTYYVWLSLDSSTPDPGDSSMALMTGLECEINDGDSADVVAEAVRAIIQAQADFGATRNTNKVTVTNATKGTSVDAEDHNTGFTILVTQQGSLCPTKNLYIAFRFDADDAYDKEIYQIGIFLNTITNPLLPAGQMYFTPAQVTNSGMLYMVENLEPFPRAAGKREIFEYVITY